MKRTTRTHTFVASLIVLLACGAAFGQAYPTKPICFIVAYPPGGTSGILAPPRMPQALVAKLNAEIARILKLPDVESVLLSQGTNPIGNSGEATHKWFAEERLRWAKVIKDSGFKLEQ